MESNLVSAVIAAVIGQVQSAIAGRMLRTDMAAGNTTAQLIDAAQQNVDNLVNVAPGIGVNLDKTI
jgi:hypothetical protein